MALKPVSVSRPLKHRQCAVLHSNVKSCTGCPAKVALNLIVVQRKDHYQVQGSSQTITAK